MGNPYAYYRAALEARRTGGRMPQCHDAQPQPGHYERTLEDGRRVAASIFWHGGELKCRIGDDMVDPVTEWVWLAGKPIEETVAFYFYQCGAWPGAQMGERSVQRDAFAGEADGVEIAGPQPPQRLPETAASGSPPIGHNQPTAPADPGVVLVAEMGEFQTGSLDWLKKHKGVISHDLQAQIATNKVGTLREMCAKARKLHKAEKDPHWTKCKEIDGKYNPTIKLCEDRSAELLAALASYANSKTAAAVAAQPDAPIERQQFKSQTGRAISVRDEPVLELEDSAKLFGHYLGKPRLTLSIPPDPRLLEAAMVCARADWKASGTPPPGTIVKTVPKAA